MLVDHLVDVALSPLNPCWKTPRVPEPEGAVCGASATARRASSRGA